MLHVGLTSSRRGLSPVQDRWLIERLIALADLHGPLTFHHGDCIGGDERGHHVARVLGPAFVERIVVHPPLVPDLRAFCKGDETREPRAYLARDRDIAGESAHLLALPEKTEADAPRSGTWYTARYAREIGRPVEVLLPCGTRA